MTKPETWTIAGMTFVIEPEPEQPIKNIPKRQSYRALDLRICVNHTPEFEPKTTPYPWTGDDVPGGDGSSYNGVG